MNSSSGVQTTHFGRAGAKALLCNLCGLWDLCRQEIACVETRFLLTLSIYGNGMKVVIVSRWVLAGVLYQMKGEIIYHEYTIDAIIIVEHPGKKTSDCRAR
jgi:hypothetical protein